MPPPRVNDIALATSLSRRLRCQCYLLSKAKHAMTVAVLIRTTEAPSALLPDTRLAEFSGGGGPAA